MRFYGFAIDLPFQFGIEADSPFPGSHASTMQIYIAICSSHNLVKQYVAPLQFCSMFCCIK